MKRVRKSGLNRKTKSIIRQVEDIRHLLITDVIVSNLSLVAMNKYFPNASYEEAMVNIFKAISDEEDIANEMIMDIVKNNNKNVEPFLNYTMSELEKEYAKGLLPAVHYTKSIAPDMMILYYISNCLEKDDRFYHALKSLDKDWEDFEKEKEIYKKNIKVKELDGTVFQHTLNAFYNGIEQTLEPVNKEEVLADLCDRYKATLTEEKQMIINPQILNFYDNEAKKIVETQNKQDLVSKIIISIFNKAFNYLRYTLRNEELYLQLDVLNKENDSINRENQFLKGKLEEISKAAGEDNTIKLEKENYYLKNRIEKLEEKNKELMQTIAELKEIVDDLPITDLPITIDKIEPENTYSGESIVIVGGHWNSISKSEVRKDYLADFIDAEDVIKFTDRIRNYDVIIFDTSRNSHINFNRLKNNKNLKMISLSKKEKIDNLFKIMK